MLLLVRVRRLTDRRVGFDGVRERRGLGWLVKLLVLGILRGCLVGSVRLTSGRR